MKTIDDYQEALEHAGSAVQEKLLAQADPLKKDLWLHADSGMWCVRGDGVRSIQVCKT